jgi:predicted HTH domain antitoxin
LSSLPSVIEEFLGRTRFDEGCPEIIRKFLQEGFEKKLEELYNKYQKGEISLGYLAKEVGVTVREAMELLEERGLRTTNWPETPPDLDSIRTVSRPVPKLILERSEGTFSPGKRVS